MSLSAADKKLVQESWDKVSKPSFADAGERVFLKLFQRNESTKAHFKKFKDIPSDQLAGQAVVRDHGEKVCKVLDDFIKGLDGSGDEAVKKVGRMHKGLGMSNEQIDQMKGAIIEVLADAGFGDANYKGAWGKLWDRFMAVHRAAY
ncbi:hemoglobin subunit alpha-D-like [Branchiostoma floridae]|uniref:Hemoglobin subunit alpha-D-like n=1 Tax=Branchiostoma floridae TaxID=7739 RepID=A0A9J7KWT8_BRAFL|nr:hemoglobin subunit alpha-D-like [Branchiostoma floridae]XP_035671460.1 hemoglobin subunit alpha-D-like [Branchiostoma floridae]